MPFFERSQNLNASGTFVDRSQTTNITNISSLSSSEQFAWNYSEKGLTHRIKADLKGFEKLQYVAVQQAIHDSSECNKPGCFPGTREEHIRTIASWGKREWESENAQVLWLHGPAGVGKSALAQTSAQGIGKNIVAATFFFNRPNGWNSPVAFLPTISYQLATRCEAYRNIVQDIIDRDPLILTKSIPVQFQELLVVPLAELRASDQSLFEKHLIIVDGLDECDHPDVVHTQCIIIQTILTSVHEQTTPFRWAIFSRPESHIRAAFSSDQHRQIVWELTLPVSSDADKDIKAYLEDGFRTIRARYHFPPSTKWPSDEAMDQLVERSAGLFVYSSNAIRYIGDDRNLPVGPEERLKVVLKLRKTQSGDTHNPYAHLDAFYILIMEQIPRAVLPTTLAYISVHIMSRSWTLQFEVLHYCSVLGLSLSAFHEAMNRLNSVLTLNVSSSGMPISLSFYHASFTEFLEGIERSTEKFCVNTPDVYRHCLSTVAETLSRLSCYNNYHELGTALIPNWSSSHFTELDGRIGKIAEDTFDLAIWCLFRHFKGITLDCQASTLTHLLAINWKLGTGFFIISSDMIEAFFSGIPEPWRSKIIRPFRRKRLDSLRQKFVDLMKGKPSKTKSLERYVLGSRENRALLELTEPDDYRIHQYS